MKGPVWFLLGSLGTGGKVASSAGAWGVRTMSFFERAGGKGERLVGVFCPGLCHKPTWWFLWNVGGEGLRSETVRAVWPRLLFSVFYKSTFAVGPHPSTLELKFLQQVEKRLSHLVPSQSGMGVAISSFSFFYLIVTKYYFYRPKLYSGP